MPYPTLDSLPDWVKEMPKHAQEIYQSAWNSAFEQYKDEGKAAATAITAVKTKYEQKNGKWVAKESAKRELQSKYQELIQEYGRKNAYKDAKRIHTIMSLCQELLDPIEEELDAERGKEVAEAIKEVDSIMGELKLVEASKTEDGIEYPSTAFAFVPELEKSSTWKLRLWEDPQKKVTRAQLGRASAALSPGGFRGQRVEIPKEDLPAVKRKIRAEYRKLDVEDEDIPRWVKESESRTLLSDFVSLAEATITTKGIATIVVIKPGLNSSKERYYAPDVLQRDYSLFEGVKMYADHPTQEDEKQRPERSIKDWVATLKNVHIDEKGQIIGEAIIVEPWMQAKLAALRDKGMLQEMGISINAVGTATKGEIEGVKTNIIERIIRVRSVDFVTEPGAGGMVQMYEVDRENDVDIVSLETLKGRRPDLVKSIETEVKAELMQEGKKKMELEEQIKEKDATIETLTKENTDLKTKIAGAEKAQRIAEAKSKIDEAISKSELPEAAKTKLSDKFKNVETAEGIAEAIKAETEYVNALKESGKVKGLGSGKTNSPDDAHKAIKEAFMRGGMPEKEAEIAAAGR